MLDIGVTHLLNTAESDVNVNPKRYTKEGISYKGFRCPDLPQADIGQFFDECVEFIDRALSFSCGKVFVNCLLVRKLIVFNSVQFYPETKVRSNALICLMLTLFISMMNFYYLKLLHPT